MDEGRRGVCARRRSNLGVFESGKEKWRVFMTRIDKSFFRIGEDFGDRFTKVRRAGVREVGAANTVFKDSVANEQVRS